MAATGKKSTRNAAKQTAKQTPRQTAKKTVKKAAAPKASWADTMKKALESKRPSGGWPDQGKPRDSAVKKLPKSTF